MVREKPPSAASSLETARPECPPGNPHPAGELVSAAGALHPVRLRSGMVVGSGVVYPEFPVHAGPDGAGAVPRCLQGIESLLEAVAGRAPGVVVDLDLAGGRQSETWQDLVLGLHEALERARLARGLPGALRVTLPAPGEAVRRAIEAGADIVNLETRTGLSLFERALESADLDALILAGGVLAAPAVSRAWAEADGQLKRTGAAGGGDCARPFIQSAVRLWRNGKASESFCAIAIAVSAVRTLASFEAGAGGPAREGAWECLIVKAIRGCPVSLSGADPWEPPVAAMADLWNSGGSLEETLAECRALSRGQGRGRPANSGSGPLSRILSAASIASIAEAIQTCEEPYQRAIAAAYAATSILREGCAQGDPALAGYRDLLTRLDQDLFSLPESGRQLLAKVRSKYGESITSGEMHP